MSQGLSPARRIQVFAELGTLIKNLDVEEKEHLFRRANNQNSWFTPVSMEAALAGLSGMLSEENLSKWLESYDLREQAFPKKVGILMAGNIPGVGFHDLMCVLLSGHIAVVKLSSSDSVVSKWLISQLILLEPLLEDYVQIQEMLKGMDAYIATGSDNSARYFHYYFGKYPSIIRANRTSVAVLSGEESDAELEALGKDVFLYFGLGCRNVSKVYVKSEDQLQRVLAVLEKFDWVAQNHKYLNNYEYNKSIYLVNGDPHLDNGFLIMKQSQELVSPIAVLFYEVYDDLAALRQQLIAAEAKIQCVVSRPEMIADAVAFGQAQTPMPWDYADRVDTMRFLLDLA